MRISCKLAGYLVFAFGIGIVLTYFLPAFILVIIEAIIIITTGTIWLTKK